MNDIKEKDQPPSVISYFIYLDKSEHYLFLDMEQSGDLYKIAIHEQIHRFNNGNSYTETKEHSVALRKDQIEHLISKLQLLVKA